VIHSYKRVVCDRCYRLAPGTYQPDAESARRAARAREWVRLRVTAELLDKLPCTARAARYSVGKSIVDLCPECLGVVKS
jgi:hypothetical protein